MYGETKAEEDRKECQKILTLTREARKSDAEVAIFR